MIFQFGRYRAEIDVEATRSYYRDRMPVNDCECHGCVNFRAYLDQCGASVKAAFARLGVDDPKRIYEIIPLYDSAKNCRREGNLYSGFFPVAGRVLDDLSGVGLAEIAEVSAITVGEGFQFFLSGKVSLCPEDFPEPILQIEIEARVPWLLEVENSYAGGS